MLDNIARLQHSHLYKLDTIGKGTLDKYSPKGGCFTSVMGMSVLGVLDLTLLYI